jgi:hypothetical protein
MGIQLDRFIRVIRDIRTENKQPARAIRSSLFLNEFQILEFEHFTSSVDDHGAELGVLSDKGSGPS